MAPESIAVCGNPVTPYPRSKISAGRQAIRGSHYHLAVSPRFAFQKAPWRAAFSAAALPRSEGWMLVGPRGVVAERVELAMTPTSRFRGLLGRDSLEPGTALLLAPCSGIHTVRMRFPIDAVFCDADLKVLRCQTLVPGRLPRPVRGARCCIELEAGAAEAAGIVPGARLRFEISASSTPT